MQNIKIIIAVAIGAFTLAGAAHAQTTTLNLATGLDSSGNLQTAGDLLDANWTITGANSYKGSAGQAYTVAPSNADWYGGWLANGANSSYICGNPDSSSNGNLDAKLTFNLSSSQLGGAVFANTAWTLDDAGTLLLNGHTEGTLGGGQWGSLHAVTINSADLVAGANTLEIQVSGSDNYLEAVRFEGSLTSPVPEPSSILAVAGGVGLLLRRKRKTA